jgi:hypothetical protein
MKKLILVSLVLLSLFTATEACMSMATNPTIEVTFDNANVNKDLITDRVFEKEGYSIEVLDRSHAKSEVERATVFIRLDCGISKDKIEYARPDGWEAQCITSPERFEWSRIFETETKALIDSGKLLGVSYEAVEEASEKIIGYDLQIQNLDSPTGKTCPIKGWQITNGKSVYLENECYKLETAAQMKTSCGGLAPHYFELKGSHSVEEPESMHIARAGFWERMIYYFKELF